MFLDSVVGESPFVCRGRMLLVERCYVSVFVFVSVLYIALLCILVRVILQSY